LVEVLMRTWLRSNCKFAFPARRSTSSLVRRRAWESRSEAELPCHLKKHRGAFVPLCFLVEVLMRTWLRSNCKFAFPARRSTSSLVRRRAWESRSEAELPCHLKKHRGAFAPLCFLVEVLMRTWLRSNCKVTLAPLPQASLYSNGGDGAVFSQKFPTYCERSCSFQA